MKKVWNYISAKGSRLISTQDLLKMTSLLVGLFHVVLMVFFWVFSIHHMVAVNLISMIIYWFCYKAAIKGENLRLLFDMIYVEIMVFSIISTLLVGIDCGFMLYLIAIIPLGYYAVYSFRDMKININPMFYVMASVIGFWGTRVVCRFIEPKYSLGNIIIDRAVYMVNYTLIVVAIVIFCSVVVTRVCVLEERHKLQNISLENLAKYDPLTGLANRRRIQERYAIAEQYNENYALIIGDIDDFKKINDTHGHDVGDEALKAVARVFKSTVRSDDIVCRWGGEEILVFLPNASKEQAVMVADRILGKIRELELHNAKGDSFRMSMTLGVSESEEASEFNEVVKKADERLYEGKKSGKNTVVSR